MTEEMYNVVDRDYGRCHEISAPRKIRTKSTSFGSIRARFNEFRLNLLQKKLDRIQEKALTDDYLRNKLEKQVDKKALAIAKLEEKIMILSKENVPENFVSNRALKLRNNMFQNLTYKCGRYYSIGLEKKEEIFGSTESEVAPALVSSEIVEEKETENSEGVPEISDIPVAAMVNSSDSDQIDVVPDSLERKQIEDAVNSEFAALGDPIVNKTESEDEIEEYTSSESSSLSANEVQSVIDESFNELESIPEIVGPYEDTPKKDESLDNVSINISTGEKTYVDDAQQEDPTLISSDVEGSSPTLSVDDIKQEVDDVINKIKVSRNESNSARVSHFDADGNKRSRRRDEYVPMTDEEIRASQEKLGFDEHGNLLPKKEELATGDKMVSTASVIGKNLTPFVVPNLSFDAVFVPTQSEEKIPETQLRGDTVLVPDRDDSEAKVVNKDFEKVDEFRMTRDDENQISTTTSSTTEYQIKRDEYNALKEKAALLVQKRDEIRRRKLAAQEAAEAAAARALEAKRMLEESQKRCDEEMNRLRQFTAELEEDCDRDLKSVELAENDAKMNETFAQMQRKKVDQNDRIISEIGSILGETTDTDTETSHKSK